MTKKETITKNRIKRKPRDIEIQREIRRNLIALYFLEIQYFNQILLFILNSNEKLYERKDRTYNKAIKISLVILKLLNNSQPQNKRKKKLTNTDLILIRWTALGMNFNCDERYLKTLAKKHPKLLTPPEEYIEAIKYHRVSENNKKDSTKYIDVTWNDFSSYIDPKIISYDYYYRYLTLLAKEIDYNQNNLPSALPFIAEGIRSFLSDIKINNENLNYVSNNIRYEKSNDSFEVVFFSNQWEKSYMNTRNRFLKHYPKKIEKKFKQIIWKKKNKSKK